MLIDGAQKLEDYLDADVIQHNPDMQDGVAGLRFYLEWVSTRRGRIHRVLAEVPALAFYDLYRAQDGKLVEHWDTTEAVPPKSEWKNCNGKF